MPSYGSKLPLQRLAGSSGKLEAGKEAGDDTRQYDGRAAEEK
jgi:hypothetical protein